MTTPWSETTGSSVPCENTSRILILGGYGSAGLPLAKLLHSSLPSTVKIVLAGRNIERANDVAESLNKVHGNRPHVSGVYADASKKASLLRAFLGCDLMVVASSNAEFVSNVVSAAMECHVDYFDLHYSNSKLRFLHSIANDIKESGCCFITEGGFHPGLPSAMVRYVIGRLDKVEVATVGSVIAIDWGRLRLSDSTMVEFADEFKDFRCEYYKDGEWEDEGMCGTINPRKMDFGPPFGRRPCIPMFLEEMRKLPNLCPTLKETGFFVGGLNWFVDWILSPFIMAWLTIFPNKRKLWLTKVLRWALEAFSSPPYGTVLKLEARGTKEDKEVACEMVVSHEDGYMFTAIPAAACLLQLLDGNIRKPGLWMQGNVVEVDKFFDDLEKLGASVVCREDYT